MPMVSVIIPTFRRPALLAQALDSVRAQTFPRWEVLVVDDDPQGSARSLLEDYQARDERIRYLFAGGGGVARARNAGIRASRGKAVAFLDDDDLFLPDKLRLQAQVLMSQPAAALVYGRMQSVNVQGQVYNLYPKQLGYTHAQLLRGNFIPISTVVVRRTALEQAGLFDPAFSNCADYELWLRVSRCGRLAPVDQVLAIYRRQQDSISRDILLSRREKLAIFLRPDARTRYGLGLRQRQAGVATSYYQLAREHVDLGQHRKAAGAFLRALRWDVLVGYRIRPRQERLSTKWLGVVKPALAAGYCAWRSRSRPAPRVVPVSHARPSS